MKGFKNQACIVSFILFNIFILLSWRILFSSNEWIAGLGVNVLQTLGFGFNFILLHRAYKKTTTSQKLFWKLLSIGTLFHLLGSGFWLFLQILRDGTLVTNIEYFLWLMAYIIYLVALIYRIKVTDTSSFRKTHLFNILVFMVTTASIMSYYLTEPTLYYSGNSLIFTVITLAYPIVNLSTLLVISILYYLIHKDKENNVLLFLIAGFFCYVTADYYYIFLKMNDSYYPGSSVDYIWLLGIWLIGLAGYVVKENNKDQLFNLSKSIKKTDVIMPYISTIVLIFIVINSYDWHLNALSYGVLIIICMIIGRQLYIIKENNSLIEEYSYLAYHDALTGLCNRVKFQETLDLKMSLNKNREIALLLIDLDRFKIVNDTLGHQVGDDLLIKVSNRLRQVIDRDMQVFRLGGDEFAVTIIQDAAEKSKQAAREILNALQDPFIVNGSEFTLTASIGVSFFPENGNTYEELFKFADAAMYLAKDNGKNGFEFYNDELSQITKRRMRIESDLRKGLEDNQFELHYQPKVELSTGRIVGMEALLRWNHPVLGWVSPVEFIPVAEETGQIVAIGEWVLNHACKQNKKWQDKNLSPLRIAVNVSVKQFQHGGLLNTVTKALKESGLSPRYLEIEVTESIMQNIKESTDVLSDLRAIGINISIDDFGTGYSSLNVIQKLPIDTIKLDKSFIAEMEDKNQLAMVKTLISFGVNLNLDIVAEGIENEYQLNKLIESQCTVGQGFLFSKPVDAAHFEKLLENTTSVDYQRSMLV